MKPLDTGQVSIQVSYHFDWQTIEGISQVLDKVKLSPGATLEEERAHHRLRKDAVASLERQCMPPERSEGLEL